MTDQGRAARANEEERFRNTIQGPDPNHALPWAGMGSWQNSSSTNLNPGTPVEQYLDMDSRVASTTSQAFNGSSGIAVTGTTYDSGALSYNFTGPSQQANWPNAASNAESVSWSQPYGFHPPQQAHQLYHNNGQSDQQAFSYNTSHEAYGSFVNVLVAPSPVIDFMNYDTGPYVPYQQPDTALGFHTAQGGHVNLAASQQPHMLDRHPQQATLTNPDTETTDGSWVIATPHTSPNRHISEGVESARHGVEELVLDSSPSNNGPSPSESADVNDTSFSPPVKAEEIPETQPLKGDPRYQHSAGRGVAALRERAPKTKVSKRTGKLTEAGREKAAKMRKTGRCLRCKVYKLGCDGNNPCQRCIKVCNTARHFLEPCCRSDLKDASLVRQSNGRFNQNPVDFRQYHFKDVEGAAPTLQVQWSLPGKLRIEHPTLSISYREYVPDSTQVLNTTTYFINSASGVKTINTSAFAACNQAQLLLDVDDLLFRAQPQVEQWILSKYKHEKDQLYLITFKEARRYRDQYGCAIINDAIRMQCGAIMSQGYGSVIGSDVHNFQPFNYSDQCDYEAYNRAKDVPVPQAIGHQFDVAILKHIEKLQLNLIKELKRRIFQSGTKPWYEIFLSCFVVLSNLEWIHDQARAYVESKKRTMLESQVSYVVRSQITKWQFSVGIVLQHFRIILKGFIPFQLAREGLPEVKARAGLDDEATTYIRDVVRLLDEQSLDVEHSSPGIGKDVPAAGRWIEQLFKQSYRPV